MKRVTKPLQGCGLDILSKNVMGFGTMSVNDLGVGGVNLEEAQFEAQYMRK